MAPLRGGVRSPTGRTRDNRTISDESRECCVQLFAALGKKIDRTAAYLRTQQRNNDDGQFW
jgi:hypothetical protein